MGVKIQLFEAGAYRSDFCLRGWMKSEVYKEKSKRKRRIGRSHYEQCCPHKARTPRRPEESYTYCCQEGWKVHWKLMVGFLNTYIELFEFIEIIYVINKCNQYVICLSFIPFVRLFMCNIQTAVSPHPLKTGHTLFMNLFTRNSPHYHLLKYLLFLLKHPVYCKHKLGQK